MEIDSELIENIKACRTCGVHYVTPSKHQLRHLFQSSLEHSEILLIRLELSQWNVEVTENDGFPQYVCNTCIHKFEQLFELRTACINAQNEFRKFYNVPNGNFSNIKVKTELPEEDADQPMCDFIYVDELSDAEYDGAAPFNFPHVPIKEEVTEAATIPLEESEQPTNIVESALVQTQPSSSNQHGVITQNESAAAGQSEVIVSMLVEPVECKLCQNLSSDQKEHKQHMQRAHEIRDLECHICGKEFKNSTPSRLKFHMKWHTLNKHVKCTLCGFVCNSKEALKEHKKVNHGKIKCKICGKGVLTKKMKSHLRQHEVLSKYTCKYCAQDFATEYEHENHIWQIHANEEGNASKLMPSSQITTRNTINENLYNESEEQFLSQEPQDAILSYKFMCAQCEGRFMEQIDLEAHVNDVHRAESHLVSIDTRTTDFVEEQESNEAHEITHNETENVEEPTNIAVFKEYDNDIHVPFNVDSSNVQQNIGLNFIQPTSPSQTASQTEKLDYEYSEKYHSETVSNTSSKEEESDSSAESKDETSSNLSTYIDGSFNTFACAKCLETFVTIEQLRQHHEQHLAASQQKQEISTKPQFKCNFCDKSFDLKFSLNRHVKKHKHAPF